MMKFHHSAENFIHICEHIATFNCLYNGQLYPHLFKYSENSNYNRSITDAIKRNIQFSLTEEDFNLLSQMNCTYCGLNKINSRGGIDRIDSNKGYTLGNVTSCCSTCNFIKKDYLREDFLKQCQIITENHYKTQNSKNTVFDLFKLKEELIDEFLSLDKNMISSDEIDTYKFSEGIYFYTLVAKGINDSSYFETTKKMIVIKR